MEIGTQQLEALLHLQEQQAQLPRKNTAPVTGFESLLNRQLNGLEQNGVQPPMVENANLYTHLLQNDADRQEADPDLAVLQAAFDEASGTLDMWDTYTATLGTSTKDTALRDAYSLLEGIDARVAQLRANPAAGRNAALDAILNELEIMSTTEKFKFNRGDYLG